MRTQFVLSEVAIGLRRNVTMTDRRDRHRS